MVKHTRRRAYVGFRHGDSEPRESSHAIGPGSAQKGVTRIVSTAIDLVKSGTPKDQLIAQINATDASLQANAFWLNNPARLEAFYEEISSCEKLSGRSDLQIDAEHPTLPPLRGGSVWIAASLWLVEIDSIAIAFFEEPDPLRVGKVLHRLRWIAHVAEPHPARVSIRRLGATDTLCGRKGGVGRAHGVVDN